MTTSLPADYPTTRLPDYPTTRLPDCPITCYPTDEAALLYITIPHKAEAPKAIPSPGSANILAYLTAQNSSHSSRGFKIHTSVGINMSIQGKPDYDNSIQDIVHLACMSQ